jgi:ABC-type multidrug transport system fused ATPase/permease subunit
MVKKSTTERLESNKKLGGYVSEVLYAIKVVVSFGQEKRELNKFEEFSLKAK